MGAVRAAEDAVLVLDQYRTDAFGHQKVRDRGVVGDLVVPNGGDDLVAVCQAVAVDGDHDRSEIVGGRFECLPEIGGVGGEATPPRKVCRNYPQSGQYGTVRHAVKIPISTGRKGLD